MSAETYVDLWEYGRLSGRFATIDYANAIEGYEWDEFHILRGADGFLYVGEGAGCSCNDFSSTDPAELVRVSSWQEAANKAREWADEELWDGSRRPVVAMDLIERLTTKRPAAHIEIDARNPFGGVR